MTVDLAEALRETPGGIIILLEVTPGAKEARFPDGYDPWRRRVRMRVRAPPEDGRANREVCALLAERFRLAADAVSISAGHTARQKAVLLRGVSRTEALAGLEEATV